jgi:cellulose synthase/poly-beta-1,6-N-acetylglucosamine synthase-like glycosyltransferase
MPMPIIAIHYIIFIGIKDGKMNFCFFFAGSSYIVYALSVSLFAYGAAVIALTLALFVRTPRSKDEVIAADTGHISDAIDGAPGVSVVIPFRNEERNLSALLASMDGQHYGGKIEVVLVNDRSADRGAELIKKFTPRNDNLCINAVDLQSSVNTSADTRLTSKQRALDLGVDRSSHRLILFTDADMILEPTWVESMVDSHLSTGADMVFGHTAIIRNSDFADVNTDVSIGVDTDDTDVSMGIDTYINIGIDTDINTSVDTDIDINTDKRGWIRRLLTLLESYQLEYLFSFARAFSKLNMTGSCMGNNILITKEAYAACGGQRGVGYTIVEDRALLALVRKRGFKAAAREPFTVTAWTYPSRSKGQFANQMLRWARGGLNPGGGLFAAGLLLLTQNIMFLLLMTGALPLILASQCVANFILTWAFLSISFHKNGSPVSKILFPAYYIFMMVETAVFLPLMLFRGGIEWKGRQI